MKLKQKKDIADLVAVVENKVWWIEDEEYNFEVARRNHKGGI